MSQWLPFFLGLTKIVDIKSPSRGFEFSITPLSRSLVISALIITLSPGAKVICLGLVACTGQRPPFLGARLRAKNSVEWSCA